MSSRYSAGNFHIRTHTFLCGNTEVQKRDQKDLHVFMSASIQSLNEESPKELTFASQRNLVGDVPEMKLSSELP